MIANAPKTPFRPRLILWLAILALTSTALLAAAAAFWAARERVPANGPPLELVVPSGSSAGVIGFLMQDAGLDVTSGEFRLMARLTGVADKLRAGVYRLPPGASLYDLTHQMARGESSLVKLTFLEGWTFAQFLKAAHESPHLQKTLPPDAEQAARQILERLLSDAELGGIIQKRLATTAQGYTARQAIEGLLFPDTFLFSQGQPEFDILTRAMRLQARVLADAWSARTTHVAVSSPEQALVLASIIERETQVDGDREMVSGVLHNRLRLGMPLQSDPTTIYALGDAFDGNLRRADLGLVSPFNTYTTNGLPPLPIANPGRAALVAAMNPSPTPALYFVAMGGGRSFFSRSLDEHNQAVNFYQRGTGTPPTDWRRGQR